ncbi:MAG: AraC family transcriptional regulator [Janthinobacterium lividum]
MDALSDVLSTLRVSSVLSSRFEGRGAWNLHFPAYQHIKFGGVLSGRFYLRLEGEEPIALDEGDFYLLTTGRPFRSASDPNDLPVDGVAVYRKRDDDRVVRHYCEGDGAPVSLASGQFTFQNDVSDLLLRHLPPLVHLHAADVRSNALPKVLDLLRLETGDLYSGAEVARSSLAALALVHVLRAYLQSTPQPVGWLGALSDSKIGRALSTMHAEPGKRWTVETLASSVAMSRTAFANRFRKLVGQAPLEYLNHWRMAIARTALRNTEEPLVDIASRIGYLSDTAFSIAFKRSTGVSPGKFRTDGRAITTTLTPVTM